MADERLRKLVRDYKSGAEPNTSKVIGAALRCQDFAVLEEVFDAGEDAPFVLKAFNGLMSSLGWDWTDFFQPDGKRKNIKYRYIKDLPQYAKDLFFQHENMYIGIDAPRYVKEEDRPRIKKLELDHWAHVPGGMDLRFLKYFSNLEEFEISLRELRLDELKSLPSSLRVLKTGRTPIYNLRTLSHLQSLETLDLYLKRPIDLYSLRRLSSLRELNLSGSVDPDGLQELIEEMPDTNINYR